MGIPVANDKVALAGAGAASVLGRQAPAESARRLVFDHLRHLD